MTAQYHLIEPHKEPPDEGGADPDVLNALVGKREIGQFGGRVSTRTKSLSIKSFRPWTLRYSTRFPASCPVIALTAPRMLSTRSPVSST